MLPLKNILIEMVKYFNLRSNKDDFRLKIMAHKNYGCCRHWHGV